MKNIYKYIGLLVIMVFSFYYTDKIALMVQSNNPIMKQINEVKVEKQVDYVNAVIDSDKIIPGKNGLMINESKSFSMMKSFGTFNSYYLVFEQKKPKISLEDNKDKIIYNGNASNKNVSLVVEYNENIIAFLESSKIKSNILINKDNYENINYLELINDDFNNYNEIELILNRSKSNNNLCYIHNKKYIDFCKKRNKYLIDSELILSNDNVFDIKNKIKSGSIIVVKNDTSIDALKIIINQVKFKGLNFEYLSKLISEENNDL